MIFLPHHAPLSMSRPRNVKSSIVYTVQVTQNPVFSQPYIQSYILYASGFGWLWFVSIVISHSRYSYDAQYHQSKALLFVHNIVRNCALWCVFIVLWLCWWCYLYFDLGLRSAAVTIGFLTSNLYILCIGFLSTVKS